jgi:hypothetical protein
MVDECLQRKAQSEQRLQQHGVTVAPPLPIIESADEVNLRPPREVARRAVVLYSVVGHTHFPRYPEAVNYLESHGLWDEATPSERSYLTANPPGDEERADYSWREEALWVLLWSLEHVAELECPTAPVEDEAVPNIMRSISVENFIEQATLRPVDQILDETDFIYRCHWAAREAMMRGDEPPGGLDPDVVYERHYALNWLVRHMDEDWDSVSTDT